MMEALRRLFDPQRRRLEKRLQLALAAGRMATWEAELQHDCRSWWSAEMYALHGLDPQAGVPPDYYALVHADDRERLRSLVDESMAACRDHSVQYRVAWPDGSVHWLEGVGTTLPDSAGRPDVMIGVCVNIDARKEDEANLQFLAQASAELSALTDYPATMQRIARLAVPHFADWCAVDMMDGPQKLRRVAVAHIDPAKVALAHRLHERFPPALEAPNGPWAVIRGGRAERIALVTPQTLEESVSDPEQREELRTLGLHSYIGVPLIARERVLGVITFVTSDSRRSFSERDLTLATDLASRAAVAIENAELVQALRQADAAKDVFLATLAHELRNPLAPIANTLALLARAPEPARQLEGALPLLQRQSAQLARLVDDLLDLARINSGKIELRRGLLDLREVLRAAVECSQPLVDQRRHALTLALPGEPVHVDGDAARLTQVFANLLNNAAKYTPEGGHISLGVEAGPAEVLVQLQDDGNGMPGELLPRVFELFTQAGQAPGTANQGLGIGLYVVRGLVRMHGGDVSADSEGAGRGSRFTVRLPRVPTPSPTVAPASPLATARQGRRVLVVDDNVDAAHALAQLLEAMGHQPGTAHDGEQALRCFAESAPEVVLLDIGLPGMNGYEVARRIRALPGSPPRLIALTGWGQAEDKRRAAEAGFDAHWTKPVDPEQLQEL